MANYGTYSDLASLKTYLSITDTSADASLLAALEQASAAIDEYCARYFQPRTATRYYTTRNGDELLLNEDLLSVTSLKCDDDGDRTYEETWTATDYDLEPYNTVPKTRIHTTPDGDYSFSTERKGVELVGLWGFGDGESATPYTDSGTDTAEELDATETAVDVVSGAVLGVGRTLLVESEQMYISAISSNTLTVVRGVNGTTAATHATAKDVYVYRYPRPVQRACLRWAARLYRLESAPFGVQGGAEMGVLPVVEPVDRETLHLLAPFRRILVG